MAYRKSLNELLEADGQLTELFGKKGPSLAERLLAQFVKRFGQRNVQKVRPSGKNAARVDKIAISDDHDLENVELTVDETNKEFHLAWELTGEHDVSPSDRQALGQLSAIIGDLNRSLG